MNRCTCNEAHIQQSWGPRESECTFSSRVNSETLFKATILLSMRACAELIKQAPFKEVSSEGMQNKPKEVRLKLRMERNKHLQAFLRHRATSALHAKPGSQPIPAAGTEKFQLSQQIPTLRWGCRTDDSHQIASGGEYWFLSRVNCRSFHSSKSFLVPKQEHCQIT